MASVQIFSNKLISTKDWLEVPIFQADGEVIDVNLHQVIIKNWDNSQTTIPIYKLMDSSFKNWRNMYNEGRRIKTAIWIDQKTIQFCDLTILNKMKNISLLESFIKSKIATDSEDSRITNLALFRQYAFLYLEKHPSINEDPAPMIRNLEPTPNGLPVQIYAFCNKTIWAEYENIKSDIIEHLLSVATAFQLGIFQLEYKEIKK